MKIAVTYENGDVFQHFGHSKQFKVYDVQDGKVVSSTILDPNGSGHGALAALLGENAIDVLICGGIGGGAQSALEERGIELRTGVSGSADEAVEAFLRGELTNTEANCDHHDHETEEGCESHDCSTCGGCHSQPPIEGKNVGKKVRTHYRGTFNDGTQFDSSYDRGEPLEFVCGAGSMIRGFDAAVANMEVGETVEIHLMPEEAYGPADPNAVFTVELTRLPGVGEVPVGERIYLQNMYGQHFPVTIVAKDEKTITFDANHEMAGKELNFSIELVEILD